MRISVYVPFVAAAVLSLAAPRLAARLPPRPAAWALTCAAIAAVLSWTGALALLAFTGLGQIPLVALLGEWSAHVLRVEDPVSRAVAALCGLVLAVAAVSLTVTAWRGCRTLLDAHRECRTLPGEGELALLDDARVEAFALPGLPGRIVVSTGMLRALGAAERDALVAHERAHLRHRHHLFLLALRAATAACPLLRPVAREGAFTVERWADEEAAAAVGDRRVVARALARAALARRNTAPPDGALAALGGPVPRRVRALLAAPPVPRRLPLVAVGLLLTTCLGSLAHAAHDTGEMFETAVRAVHPRHGAWCAGDGGQLTGAVTGSDRLEPAVRTAPCYGGHLRG